jgi:hypothetical protein
VSYQRQQAIGKAVSNRNSAAKHLSVAGLLPVGVPGLPETDIFQETRQALEDKIDP